MFTDKNNIIYMCARQIKCNAALTNTENIYEEKERKIIEAIKDGEVVKEVSENSNEVLGFINADVIKHFNEFMTSGEYYYNNAEEISRISEDSAAMSEQLNASIQEINSIVETMSTNTEKSTKNSSKILESITQTTISMEQVAATAESQAVLAQDLNDLIEGFKI